MPSRCILAGILFLATVANGAVPKPNILFLFADDMRADTIHAHGNPYIETPNLDRLVKEGTSFRRNYVFGGNSGALCVPSRAMLMTGKTWFNIHAPTVRGEKLLPELLGEKGYQTFGTGKWHNGQEAWLRAFQQGKTIMFGGMSDHTKVPVRDLGSDGKLTPERIAEKFSSEMFADSAIEFLKKRDRTKPYFCYVAFTAPHDPRQAPQSYLDKYYKKLPPLPKNFLPQLPFDNGMMNGGRDENLGAWPRTEKMIREQLAEYYALITHMDDQIGRILDALEAADELDNTLIAFVADNGLALGSHGLLGKQSVFEHSMKTPLILIGRGIPKGKSIEAFTYIHDLFPTLCEVAGVQQPKEIEGINLKPLVEGRTNKIRDTVFLPFLEIQRAVRDDQWKLIAYPKIGHLQLFDLNNDPHEITNLIDKPELEPVVYRLRQAMAEWQSKVGDKVVIPVKNTPPPRIDLTGKKREPDQWQPEWIINKYFRAN